MPNKSFNRFKESVHDTYLLKYLNTGMDYNIHYCVVIQNLNFTLIISNRYCVPFIVNISFLFFWPHYLHRLNGVKRFFWVLRHFLLSWVLMTMRPDLHVNGTI